MLDYTTKQQKSGDMGRADPFVPAEMVKGGLNITHMFSPIFDSPPLTKIYM